MPLPPKPRRSTRKGTESKGVFKTRLRKENRFEQYVADRDKYLETHNCSSTAAHNAVYEKYAPQIPGTDSFSGPEDLFDDKLPNGCPLFDKAQWAGKPQTNLLDDVQWVASCLGLKNFDYTASSPSLRACTLYWEARYTATGMLRYQELLRQLEVPDKATLKQLNSRKDDGAELVRLSDFLTNYSKHLKEQG